MKPVTYNPALASHKFICWHHVITLFNLECCLMKIYLTAIDTCVCVCNTVLSLCLTWSFVFQYLTTVIPYEKKTGSPPVEDLQILTKSECFTAACFFFRAIFSALPRCMFCFQKCNVLPPLLPLPSLVLHAMRDDSEKVPALLTDYILKGKHTAALSHLHASVSRMRSGVTLVTSSWLIAASYYSWVPVTFRHCAPPCCLKEEVQSLFLHF